MAFEDWLTEFRRHHKLSLRTPEQTSLSGATSFNKINVTGLFENRAAVKESSNLDYIIQPPKVLLETDKKQMGQVTSAEQGQLVTLVCIVGATGKSVPAFFIFSMKKFQQHFLKGAPPVSSGGVSDSGWTNGKSFVDVLKHFVLHERPGREHRKLIVLDGHESHASIEAFNYAKGNGIFF